MATQCRVDIDFGGIAMPTNLPTPVNATDAANKAYVDTVVGASVPGSNNEIVFNDGGVFGTDSDIKVDASIGAIYPRALKLKALAYGEKAPTGTFASIYHYDDAAELDPFNIGDSYVRIRNWSSSGADYTNLDIGNGSVKLNEAIMWHAANQLALGTTASSARTALALGSLATLSTINNAQWSGTVLSVSNGGTGSTTFTGYVKGNGTGAMTASATIPSTDVIAPGSDLQVLVNNSGALGTVPGFTYDASNRSMSLGNDSIPNVGGNPEIGAFANSGQFAKISFDSPVLDGGDTYVFLSVSDGANLTIGESNYLAFNGNNVWHAGNHLALGTTASSARTALGLGALATLAAVNNSNWSGTALSVANGGTGVSTLTGYVKGSGTSAMTASATIPLADIAGVGDAASRNIGTSGATVPLHSTNNTWSGQQTFTSTFTVIGDGSANAIISLNSSAAGTRRIDSFTAGLLRWRLEFSDGTEEGANSGSDVRLRGYNDAGAVIINALRIQRATGLTTIAGGLTATPISGSTVGTVATTAAAALTVNSGAGTNVRCLDVINSGSVFRMGLEYDNTIVKLNIVDRSRVPIVEIFESGSAKGVFVTGSVSASGPLGYGTGAGGTVTQATSKTTGVTLAKPSGRITMNAATLAANAVATFTLTNSFIAATDLLVLSHFATGTLGDYEFSYRCAAGSASIFVRNVSGGSLSEAVQIGFSIMKGSIT